MKGAPPAKIAAEVVFVGDGVSMIGVESHGRKKKSAAGNFLRHISRCGRIPKARASNTRLANQVVLRLYGEFFPEQKGGLCPSLVIIGSFSEFFGDFHAVFQRMNTGP